MFHSICGRLRPSSGGPSNGLIRTLALTAWTRNGSRTGPSVIMLSQILFAAGL